MVAEQPLIGITCRRRPGKTDYYLPADYSQAVYAGGGLPVMLPLIDASGYLEPLLGRLDGVLFSGSATDVAPELYGAKREPWLGPVDPLRDAVDSLLARQAVDLGMPVLAICYGFQMLNVVLGGSLVQDLRTTCPDGLLHERRDAGDPPALHPVNLLKGSLLADLAGTSQIDVNSSHHQAIDRLAADLCPTATAPDGTIEAAEHRGTLPLLAVQWHPEKSFAEDAVSRRLFEYFISQCRMFRTGRSRRMAKR